VTAERLGQLKEFCASQPGETEVCFEVLTGDGLAVRLRPPLRLKLSPQFTDALRALCGEWETELVVAD
jgi:hypothetical protein